VECSLPNLNSSCWVMLGISPACCLDISPNGTQNMDLQGIRINEWPANPPALQVSHFHPQSLMSPRQERGPWTLLCTCKKDDQPLFNCFLLPLDPPLYDWIFIP
jgi:hypothetical protein